MFVLLVTCMYTVYWSTWRQLVWVVCCMFMLLFCDVGTLVMLWLQIVSFISYSGTIVKDSRTLAHAYSLQNRTYCCAVQVQAAASNSNGTGEYGAVSSRPGTGCGFLEQTLTYNTDHWLTRWPVTHLVCQAPSRPHESGWYEIRRRWYPVFPDGLER